jgi:hypothetical protein
MFIFQLRRSRAVCPAEAFAKAGHATVYPGHPAFFTPSAQDLFAFHISFPSRMQTPDFFTPLHY